MTLHDEVLRWQDGLKFCAIYRHGIDIGDGPEKGKRPDVKHQKTKGVEASVAVKSLIEKPETYGAIGLYTGQETGIVIYDIDRNLYGLQQEHPELLDSLHVTSTRDNAAKFIFQVAESDREKLKGGEIPGKHGEILYGNFQGVIYGAYKDEGEYSIHGDPSQIPPLPDFIYDQMLPKKQPKKAKGWTTFWNDVSRGRTDQQMLQILEECLSVIPNTGIGGYDFWVMLGMACKSTGIEGALGKWREWAWRDEEYHEAGYWDHGADPCGEKWEQIDAEGGVTIGTIVQLAQEHDPENKRLPADLRQRLELKESLKEFKVDGYEELIKAAKAAMEEDDPGLVQHKLHQLAIANGYRDSSAVSRLLLAHEEYATGSNEMSLKQLFAEAETKDIEFLIPDLVPLPGTMLFHGLGGCGKTMTAMHIARHVARGLPYTIKGREVPVKQGRVLWLNGDQNPSRLYRQFQEAGYGPDDDVIVLSGVSMLWQPWFIRQVEKHKPRLVVWDSVTSCMRGSAVDQNRAEYADPMYFYSAKNGTAYDAIGQIFIHHQNQEGGARGTTALVDAVDEVWSIRKPNKDEKEKLGNNRVIEIGKSREDNEGRTFYVKRKDDLTLQIDETSDIAGGSDTPIDQMLGALRYRDEWMSAKQIYALPIGGSETTKKVNLTRLVNKGLVKRQGAARSFQYRAVLAHVGSDVSPTLSGETPVVPGDVLRSEISRVSHERVETQKTEDKKLTYNRPSQNPVPDSDLANKGGVGTGPHTRDPFSSEGLTD